MIISKFESGLQSPFGSSQELKVLAGSWHQGLWRPKRLRQLACCSEGTPWKKLLRSNLANTQMWCDHVPHVQMQQYKSLYISLSIYPEGVGVCRINVASAMRCQFLLLSKAGSCSGGSCIGASTCWRVAKTKQNPRGRWQTRQTGKLKRVYWYRLLKDSNLQFFE